MEQIALFEEKVVLAPIDLRQQITSFDDILLRKARKQMEGKCSRHGYIVPDSLTILSRSLGIAEKGRFTSDFLFYLKLQGKVYNPPDGFQIEGEVLRKNKMGLYLVAQDAIQIMVPRDLHIGNDEFDSVEMGDRVRVEIKKSRFQVNDPHILSIGQFLGKVGSASAPAAVPAEEEMTSSTEEDENTDESESAEEEASSEEEEDAE